MKTKIIITVVMVILIVTAACKRTPPPQNQNPSVIQIPQVVETPKINKDEHEHNENRDKAIRKLTVSVDKINSISDEMTSSMKENHYHDVAKHCEDIRMEIDSMLDDIIELSNEDFAKLKEMLNNLRKSMEDTKHFAEKNDHDNVHHTYSQFIKDFADLRVAMPKV